MANQRRDMRALGWLWILALFLVNVRRAVRQSIVHDEAVTVLQFADHPWSHVFGAFDANHHVLHTIGVKLSIGVAGLSEATTRAPALLGGALYLVCVYLVTRHFLSGSRFWIALLLATSNPFVLDHLVMARGYGMALGFLALAQLLLLDAADRPKRTAERHIALASLALGLSVSSNLAFAFAAAGVIAAAFLALGGAPRTARPRELAKLGASLTIPGAAIFAAVCGAPLRFARSEHFYIGFDTLSQSAASLASKSLLPSTAGWPGSFAAVHEWVAAAAGAGLLVAIGLVALVGCAELAAGPRDDCSAEATRRRRIFVALSPGLALAFLIAAHLVAGVNYPAARSVLYLATMMPVAVAFLLETTRAPGRLPRSIRWPVGALGCIALLLFAAAWRTDHFSNMRYDAATRRMFEQILATRRVDGAPPLRLGLHWHFEPAINFYRRAYDAEAVIARAERRIPIGDEDWFLLYAAESDALVTRHRLVVVDVEPVAGSLLAARASLAR